VASTQTKFHPTFPSFSKWISIHDKRTEDQPQDGQYLTPSQVTIEVFLEFASAADKKAFISEYAPTWNNPLFPEKVLSSDPIYNISNESSKEDSGIQLPYHFIGAFRCTNVLWLQATYEWLQHIEADPRIKMIHYNFSMYLCLNQVNRMFETAAIRHSFFEFQGSGVKVGILDTGIDQTHPDLQNQIIDIINTTGEEPGDLNGHGTMLAGTIAGTGRASQNVFQGLAPKTSLIDIKVFNQNGSSKIADVLLALDLILDRSPENRPHIILFGGTTAVPWSEDDLLSLYCSLLIDQNIILICPSGNFGPDPGFIPSPAGHPKVLCVGSVDFDQKITFFTGRYPKMADSSSSTYRINKPNVYFPGTDVVVPSILSSFVGTTVPHAQNYVVVSGTSISAAIATGLCSLLKEAFPNKSVQELFELFPQNSEMKLDLISIFQNANKFFPKPLSYRKLIRISGGVSLIFVGLSIGLYFLINYFR
jgi:subtilisin family serine protease